MISTLGAESNIYYRKQHGICVPTFKDVKIYGVVGCVLKFKVKNSKIVIAK
jgi:hypothetical protein